MGFALSPAALAIQRAMLTGGGRMVMHRSAQNYFFDRALVLRSMDRVTADALRWAGGHVRHRARNSIYRRIRPSRPGQPPNRHTGKNAYASLTNIWFAYDPSRKSVVVGSLLIWNKYDPPVPERMEFGYTARDVPNPFYKFKSMGDSVPAIVQEQRPRGKAAQWKRWQRHRQFFQRGGGKLPQGKTTWILWRRARTSAELSRGRKLQEQVWGPPRISYTVEPRPYMNPALRKSKNEVLLRFGNRLRVA